MGKIVRYTLEELMAKTTPSNTDWDRVRRDVENDNIDFSDIPELDAEWFRTARRPGLEQKPLRVCENVAEYDATPKPKNVNE